MTHSHDTATPALSAETVPSEEFVRKVLETARDYISDAAAGTLTYEDSGEGFKAMAAEDLVRLDAALSASHLAKEGGEGVVVPYDDFHAAYQFVPRSKMSPDHCLKTRLRSLLRDEDLAHADEAEAIAAAPAPNPSPAAKGGDAEALTEAMAFIKRYARHDGNCLTGRDGDYGEKTCECDFNSKRVRLRAKIAALATPSPQPADAVREALIEARRGEKWEIEQAKINRRWFDAKKHSHAWSVLDAIIAALASDPAPAGEAVEPVGFINESFRDALLEQKGKGYWHHQMVCGKRFDGSFPIYLARPAPEDTARLREALETIANGAVGDQHSTPEQVIALLMETARSASREGASDA